MANIKQQIKRANTNNKKRLLNNSFESSLRTAMTDFKAKVAAGNKEEATAAFSFLCKKLDKSLSKGINNKSYVARQKSRCAKLLNTLA